MDNNLTNNNTLFNINQPPAPAPLTPQQPSSNENHIEKVKRILFSKKLIFIIIAVVIIIVLLSLLTFKIIKDQKSAQIPKAAPSPSPVAAIASIVISSDKVSYRTSETVKVSVIANSANIPVTGFDIVFEYDPEVLTLTKHDSPLKDNYLHYGKDKKGLISISGVLKAGSKAQVFKETNIFSLEFTPKKAAKTSLVILYSPAGTNESNILNDKSEDILGSAGGREITIE